jgi:hypothetical protein
VFSLLPDHRLNLLHGLTSDRLPPQRGLIDKRGTLRATWLTKLESLIAAALSIDRLLGLDRRSKNLHMDVAEILAAVKRRGGEHDHVHHLHSDTETGQIRADTDQTGEETAIETAGDGTGDDAADHS